MIAAIGIEMVTFADLYRDAFDLSTAFSRRRSYDAEYVALARHLGCELWTADLGLVRAFGPQFDWIRTLDA